MIEREMTDAECAAFGVTRDEQRDLSNWALARTGQMIGANGRGGSGLFVETDGGTALLTARHVVLPALLSGDYAVIYTAAHVGRSTRVIGVRIATKSDAALVYVGDLSGVPRLRREDWDASRAPPTPRRGAPVIAAGAPGELKSEPDLGRRVIARSATVLFWTAVIEPRDADGLIVLDIDERQPVPRSFGGMSGGPVFNPARQLLGINHGQRRGLSDGMLFVTPRAAWRDLHDPFVPPPDVPGDGRRQRAEVALFARHQHADRKSDPIEVRFAGEFFWSPTHPEHSVGAIGRIDAMTLRAGPASPWLHVSLELLFPLPNDHDEADRKAAARAEAVLLTEALGYAIV